MPSPRATSRIVLLSLSIAAGAPLAAQPAEADLVSFDCTTVVGFIDTVYTFSQSDDPQLQAVGQEVARSQVRMRAAGETRPNVMRLYDMTLEMIDEAWEWSGSREDLLLRSRGRCEIFQDSL